MTDVREIPTAVPANEITATILVVEDDALIREIVTEHLRDSSFHVLEACCSDEAISVLQWKCQSVDIVFSDIRMPGSMDGFALAQWVRTYRPDIQVILTSGYTGSAERATELGYRECVLPKPYKVAELLRRIKSLVPAAC